MTVLLIILAVIVVVGLAITAPSGIQRMGKAAEDQQRASMPGGGNASVEREFERPRDEGDLL